MLAINHKQSESSNWLLHIINRYDIFDFMKSSLCYQITATLVMFITLVYGINFQVREIIVYSLFNGLFSLGLLFLTGWIKKKNKVVDKFYTWSSILNYLIVFSLFVYLFFFPKFNIISVSLVMVNVLNLCVILSILNFRSNNYHDWNELKRLTTKRDNFKFKITVAGNFTVVMSAGTFIFHFDKLKFKGVDYDIYKIKHYFEENNLDLATVTDDDLALYQMIRY
jgi:hypothetical protein